MKRLVWADSLKGILIILVVLGHAIQSTLKGDCFNNHLWNYIYSFHMAAFMAISGFLSYRTGVGITNRLSIIYKRFRQLLVPFLLWSIIKLLIYQRCSLTTLADVFLYPDGYFWFLWVLFFIAVFFQIGDWLAERLRIKQEVIIIGFCLLFVVLMVVADIRILGYQFFAYYFLFYVIGYFLNKHNRFVTTKTWVLCLLATVWAVMAWFWNMHELPSFLKGIPLPQTIMQYAYRFITALIAVYVLFGIGPKLLSVETPWNAPFVKLGKISLGIYVVHLLLMPIIVKGISACFDNTIVIVTLSFMVAFAVSWLAVWLLSKWKVSNRLLLGKI